MISFIVIGKNEGWKLTRCIESIYFAIKNNNIKNYEIIYVDSKSTDDSLIRAKEFNQIKILLITGYCNAAIGRNAGAKESSGEILFFLDGDMELNSNFINETLQLFNKNNKFISGQIEEYYYNEKWHFLEKRMIFPNSKLNKFDLTNGGAFIVDRSLWQLVNGMRTKYDRSQDIDFNYRLIKKGTRIFRSKETFVIHHTIQYNHDICFWQEVKNFRNYLYRGLLIREHLFNYKIIRRNIRINYTLILLIIAIFLSTFVSVYFILIYFAAISARSFSQYQRFNKVVNSSVFSFFFKILYIDINGIIGALFFYPKSPKVAYTNIQ